MRLNNISVKNSIKEEKWLEAEQSISPALKKVMKVLVSILKSVFF